MEPRAVIVGYAQLDDRNVTTQAGYTHAAGDGEVVSRDSGCPPRGGAESLPRSPEDGSEAQPSIFLQPQVRVPPTYPRYRQRASTVLGALQVTLALCAMILNLGVIVTILTANRNGYSYFLLMGYALWCSLLYVISGALAIEAGRRARRGVVVGSLVMATMSALIAWVHIYCALIYFVDEYFYHVKVNQALSIVLLVSWVRRVHRHPYDSGIGVCRRVLQTDLNESSFPDEILDRNAIYYKGQDVKGNPICTACHWHTINAILR